MLSEIVVFRHHPMHHVGSILSTNIILFIIHIPLSLASALFKPSTTLIAFNVIGAEVDVIDLFDVDG